MRRLPEQLPEKKQTFYELTDSDGSSRRVGTSEIQKMLQASSRGPINADPSDAVAERKAAVLASAYGGAMAPFRQIILASESRDECLAQLARAYADWKPERLVAQLEEALALCAAEGIVAE